MTPLPSPTPNDPPRRARSSEWRVIAEWDWVQIGRGRQLHAIRALHNAATADDDWYGEGVTECGKSGHLSIPGILTRMSAQRCVRCCVVTGMPFGTQSPKNDERCRPVAEARIEALA